MKVGILYPSSKAHPRLGLDFTEGLRTLLKERALTDKIHLFFETIGFGGNEKEVYQKTEKFLVIDGVDLLVAFIDLRVLQVLKPLVYASGKLLIVVNPGANYPENWVPQPNIIHLTLNHSFLCWLTGSLTDDAEISRAAMATTFYDGGYLQTAAIVNRFVKSGGTIGFNYVNNQKYDHTFNIDQLTEFLASNKETRNILCIFDSEPALLFYRLLQHFRDAGRLRLFVSPMMLEEGALESLSDDLKFSVEGYSPWIPSVEGNSGHDLGRSFPEQTKGNFSSFKLLGFETGLILQAVYQHSSTNYSDGARISSELLKMTLESPRGPLKLDPDTLYFVAPVYKCSLKPGSPRVEVDRIENTEPEWKAFTHEPTVGITSGWTNTYLCY